MDLVSAGEDSYAAMRRSTNGGGENSPLLQGEDDLYEMFLIELTYKITAEWRRHETQNTKINGII